MNTKTAKDHIIFVEGAGKDLISRGRLKGPISITPKGIADYNKLMASEWKPNRTVVRWLVAEKMGLRSEMTEVEKMTDLIIGVADVCESARV